MAVIEEIREEAPVYEEPPMEEDDFVEDEGIGLSPDDADFVHEMILKIIVFLEDLCDVKLYPYQTEIVYRVAESVIINDGEEITVIAARQCGKSEALSNTIATLMVLLPRLAKVYPEMLGKFSKGFWVGVFAPTEGQAETVWNRVYERLDSPRAKELFVDPEIDEKVTKRGGKSRTITLLNSGSLCRMQTANPKAKIESKSYHFLLVDEAQDADTYIVEKSIAPTLAHYNGSRVYTGTPSRTKNVFYKACHQNKLRQLQRHAKQNHFEYTWRTVVKYNENYKKYVAKEKARLGEDSDEFQMSYNCKWMLEEGMFVTEEKLNELGDVSMEIVHGWWRTPVLVGIDPARTNDSTVVTVVWVDWEHPDAYGYYEHRILNWLEIHNKPWEIQYALIAEFLSHYNVLRIAVDAQGMGGPVAERLQTIFPNIDVVQMDSGPKAQSERWKHMKTLIERRRFVYPAHSKTRRLRTWKRFHQQMIDLETKFQGQFLLAAAPDVRNAFDDYGDSAALACVLSIDDIMLEAEVVTNPFYTRK